MRGTLTHLVTIEQYQETGETVDDGAGGTIPVEEWVAVVDNEPCRYEPAGKGYVREDQGGRVYSSPRIYLPARTAGHMGPNSEFVLDIDEGDDWRLRLASVDGEFAIRSVDVHYSGPQQPSHVLVELEDVEPEGSS
ncbi:hypothetical protein [Haloparvum sedimenti]|uniref:hypothetical protein n=1 Tax=Haloparvum sedimenti TaxID=1678448 RepID=UPI00071E7D41|nr:hypothetical protein [Haloparvum sedimenti]